MIRLETNLPAFFNELCEVIRLFLGAVEIRPEGDGDVIVHEHSEENGLWIERFAASGREIRHTAPAVRGGLEEKRQLKRAAKTGCFLLMRELTGVSPPWGSLTGIRPTRLMYELRERGVEGEAARRAMEETFYVSPDKARLLSDILEMQKGLVDTPENEYDLYIGIPFCTTRCAYCSFASGELGKGALVEPYLAALKREMALDAALMDELGLAVRAAYMGGGTPTALTARQLDGLLREANRLFPGAREWTVEAGRPDTIDRDKLQVLLDNGVERISVNPQTFSDETLRIIGRAHTAQQTVEAYELARQMGFHHINMDLIAALPGENEADFLRSLARTVELAPESVTVHTLAIKRSSRLHEQGYLQADAGAAARMVDGARRALAAAGYAPYYLYRQKYMAGNLENVGYARPGYACLYNIDNMEETTRILAEGAGAITKWLFPRERRIERAPNLRNIEQYIQRVQEMAARKRTLILSQEA
ncbi:MAG: coproporphyrinogen dehydrogenase HemZ [Clostridia bacterium]|nr:coproporphyrinogen dehydrogenase HemZ [Clostridia bacterium]